VQERATVRDGDSPYNLVLSLIFAFPGEETTPARPGRHGMSGKDGTLLVESGDRKGSRIIKNKKY
jgi:hypothetical protein